MEWSHFRKCAQGIMPTVDELMKCLYIFLLFMNFWSTRSLNLFLFSCSIVTFKVSCSSWKDDETTAFSGGFDKQLKMWVLPSGRQLVIVAMHDSQSNMLHGFRKWTCWLQEYQAIYGAALPDQQGFLVRAW